jgi:hypothetical protein
MAYDVRPLSTLEEKKDFLNEARLGNYVLFFEHDPTVECCELQDTEKGVRPSRQFRLDEI